APCDFLQGDPVLLRPDRPLALAARGRRRVDSALPRVLLGVRSSARFVCGGGVTAISHEGTKLRRPDDRDFRGPVCSACSANSAVAVLGVSVPPWVRGVRAA